MSNSKINPNIVEYFVEELQHSFTIDVVQIGYSLFKTNGITDLDIYPDALHATVNGSDLRRYRVELDGDFFGISTCACKNAGYCEHMAALVFHSYGLTGNRPEWLMKEIRSAYDMEQNLQKQQEKRQQAKLQKEKLKMGLSNKNQLSNQRQSHTIQNSRLPQLHEGSSAADWLSFFNSCMEKDRLAEEYEIQSFSRIFDNKMISVADHWSAPLRQLYQIFMNLKFLSHLDTYFQFYHQASQYTFYMQPSQSAFEDCTDHIMEILEELDPDPEISKHYPSYVEAIIDLIRGQTLFHENSPVNWLGFYRILWNRLFIKPEWRESEYSRLETSLNELNALGASDFEKSQVCLLLAHLYVIRVDHSSAFEILEPYAAIYKPKLFFSYLDAFLQTDRWESLKAWLNWLKPMVRDGDQDVFISYVQFWNHLHYNQPCHEEIERLLVDFLPRSYYMFSHFLMDGKSYRQWVDVTLLLQVPADHWEPATLAVIEQEDPQSLIPLYHHDTRQLIEKRNRDSYKQAVKVLKKLRTLYNKLKEQETWQQFIIKLAHRYSRLRALQEELKKGKLIS
jgi:hypothetical protein